MSTSVLSSATAASLVQAAVNVASIVNTLDAIVSSPFSNAFLVNQFITPANDSLVRLSGVFHAAPTLSGQSAVLSINYTDRDGAFQTLVYELTPGINLEINKNIFIKGGTTVSASADAGQGQTFLANVFLHISTEIL